MAMKSKKHFKKFILSLISLVMGSSIANAATPPFFPITIQKIKVPEKVYPWLRTYTPDGKNILF